MVAIKCELEINNKKLREENYDLTRKYQINNILNTFTFLKKNKKLINKIK